MRVRSRAESSPNLNGPVTFTAKVTPDNLNVLIPPRCYVDGVTTTPCWNGDPRPE